MNGRSRQTSRFHCRSGRFGTPAPAPRPFTGAAIRGEHEHVRRPQPTIHAVSVVLGASTLLASERQVRRFSEKRSYVDAAVSPRSFDGTSDRGRARRDRRGKRAGPGARRRRNGARHGEGSDRRRDAGGRGQDQQSGLRLHADDDDRRGRQVRLQQPAAESAITSSVEAQGFKTLERDVDVRSGVPIDVDLTLDAGRRDHDASRSSATPRICSSAIRPRTPTSIRA